MASLAASTSGSSSRRRSREWLPSFPSLGLLMPRRTRPLKFQCELTVHALRDYPQSGQLLVKARVSQEAKSRGDCDIAPLMLPPSPPKYDTVEGWPREPGLHAHAARQHEQLLGDVRKPCRAMPCCAVLCPRPSTITHQLDRWEAPFSFLEGFRVDEETNLPLPRMLHLSIRQVGHRQFFLACLLGPSNFL